MLLLAGQGERPKPLVLAFPGHNATWTRFVGCKDRCRKKPGMGLWCWRVRKGLVPYQVRLCSRPLGAILCEHTRGACNEPCAKEQFSLTSVYRCTDMAASLWLSAKAKRKSLAQTLWRDWSFLPWQPLGAYMVIYTASYSWYISFPWEIKSRVPEKTKDQPGSVDCFFLFWM